MSHKKKYSVLVVDDERSNISVLRSILSFEYNIFAATDGLDALDTAEDFLPDVILLDIVMPEMDGYEIITQLKKTEKTKNIPVIFITGLNDAEAEEKGLALGAVDYISKPFNPTIVKLRVRNQIDMIEQLRQQVLMTKISHNFLSDTYIDSLFAETLRIIGLFMDTAQILLYKYDRDKEALVCQCEWLKPELKLETCIGKTLLLVGPIGSVIESLITGHKDYLRSSDWPLSATVDPDRESLKRTIIKPVFVKGKLFALLDFSIGDDRPGWTESELTFTTLVADIFAGVFERDAMERQFSIVEKTPDLILSVNIDGELEYVNPAVVSVTGYTKQDLITDGLGVIFQGNLLEAVKKRYILKAMREDDVQFEMDLVRKDGEKHVFLVSIFQREKNSFGMIFKDLTRIRLLEEENKKIFFDGLTGIYNRRFFDEMILSLITSLSRSGSMLSLMMIDIDVFKKYNDTYGHPAGDECLKIVAETIRKSLPRTDDFVARYGGEEFVVVLPNTGAKGACTVADRLMARMKERNIPHETSDFADRVTFSIGIVSGLVQYTHTADDFKKVADEMLYESKNNGRNKYSVKSV